MKILYINVVHSQQKTESGGSFINKRNIKILKEIYKESNFEIYDMIYYTSPFQTLSNTLFCRAGGYKKDDLKRILPIIKEKNISVVFIGFSNAGTLAKDLKKNCSDIKVITFCQNNEYTFLKQSLKSFSCIKRIAYTFNVHATYVSEKNACKYSDILITINQRDSDVFLKLYGRKADYTIPISFNDNFNLERAINTQNEEHFILFVGSNFFGNTEGLFWFIENCMKKIQQKLIVVGSGMDIYKEKYPNMNVTFLGYVDDLSEYYYKASAVVLPIISGSGMKTKTCEALMYGKTIFGTKEAFEGYECDYDKIGKLCTTSEDFIENLNSFFNKNKNIYNDYSRSVYETNYSNKVITEKVYNFLNERDLL